MRMKLGRTERFGALLTPRHMALLIVTAEQRRCSKADVLESLIDTLDPTRGSVDPRRAGWAHLYHRITTTDPHGNKLDVYRCRDCGDTLWHVPALAAYMYVIGGCAEQQRRYAKTGTSLAKELNKE